MNEQDPRRPRIDDFRPAARPGNRLKSYPRAGMRKSTLLILFAGVAIAFSSAALGYSAGISSAPSDIMGLQELERVEADLADARLTIDAMEQEIRDDLKPEILRLERFEAETIGLRNRVNTQDLQISNLKQEVLELSQIERLLNASRYDVARLCNSIREAERDEYSLCESNVDEDTD